MKICILMCGLKRTYDDVKLTFHDNFINVLLVKGVEIDTFVHSDAEIDLYNLKGSIISSPEEHPNIPIQFSRFHECYFKSVVPYMTTTGTKYDFFVCVRPDNYYFKNCIVKNIDEWDTHRINVRMRIYPTPLDFIYQTGYIERGVETIDDQFYIIPNEIANTAFLIEKGEHPILCKCDWNEGMLTKLWNSHNIQFTLFPINTMIYNWQHDPHKRIYNTRKRIEDSYIHS